MPLTGTPIQFSEEQLLVGAAVDLGEVPRDDRIDRSALIGSRRGAAAGEGVGILIDRRARDRGRDRIVPPGDFRVEKVEQLVLLDRPAD